MKKGFKMLFASLAVVLGMGAAGVAGMTTFKEVASKPVAAATSETTFYIDVSSCSMWSSGIPSSLKAQAWGGTAGSYYYWYGATGSDANHNIASVTVGGNQYYSFTITDCSDSTAFNIYCWGYGSKGNQTADINFSSFSSGQNLITITNSNNSDWNQNVNYTLGTLVVSTTHTITKYANYWGTVDTTYPLGTDTVSGGDTYATPDPIYKDMCHFVGWYSNSACTVSWDETATINSDTPIYAKYTQLTDDSYIYWVSESESPVFSYVHFWHEKQTTDPGLALSSFEVTGVVTFNGLSQKIYKIPVPSTGYVSCAFHDGSWGAKTYDIGSITPGAAYYTWLNDGESAYSWNANTNAAKSLELIFKVEAARNAVTASGSIKNYSICGINPSTAKSLYEEYYELSNYGDAKTLVDNSYTYTYSRTDSSTETNISFYDIMAELAELAVKNGLTVNGYSTKNISFMFSNDNSTSVVIVISALLLAGAAVGGYFLLRKKRVHH